MVFYDRLLRLFTARGITWDQSKHLRSRIEKLRIEKQVSNCHVAAWMTSGPIFLQVLLIVKYMRYSV